jgi:hypothetical protein
MTKEKNDFDLYSDTESGKLTIIASLLKSTFIPISPSGPFDGFIFSRASVRKLCSTVIWPQCIVYRLGL